MKENVTRLRARLSLKSDDLVLPEPQAVLTSALTLGVVTRACNPSLGESEAGAAPVISQAQSEPLS